MRWQKGKNMKISNYMDNANLIMETNANKIQKENSQTIIKCHVINKEDLHYAD